MPLVHKIDDKTKTKLSARIGKKYFFEKLKNFIITKF